MGFDTTYFGPSAWQLLHLISFDPSVESSDKIKLLSFLKYILPCKYCRRSVMKFEQIHGLPKPDSEAEWLFDLHNHVNDKLRRQSKKDPSIKIIEVNPTFEEIQLKYNRLLSKPPTQVPGRDFLFTVASNYADKNIPNKEEIEKDFIQTLGSVYPFMKHRRIFQNYLMHHPVDLKLYSKWMYGLLFKLSAQTCAKEIPSYRGFMTRIMYYKSGCSKKTYRGVTCRVLKGGFTKSRNRRRTFRVTRASLLTTQQ